jgi:hypothetical protein
MNTNRKSHPAFTHEALNIMVGKSIGANVLSGLRHGYSISRSDSETGNVLYINTMQTTKQLNQSIEEALGGESRDSDWFEDPGHRCIYFISVLQGELSLHSNKWEIINYIKLKNVRTIIINSWEWASKNYSLREDLQYFIQDLTQGDPHRLIPAVSVLVYVQERKSRPEAGLAFRGGLGKLAGMAKQVINISDNEMSGTEISGTEISGTDFSPSERTEVRSTEEIHSTEEVSIIEEEHTKIPIHSEILRMPVHQNNYLPDKKPVIPDRSWALF